MILIKLFYYILYIYNNIINTSEVVQFERQTNVFLYFFAAGEMFSLFLTFSLVQLSLIIATIGIFDNKY